MGIRLRILQIATVCLYLGPLLAGVGGYGWLVVPVFVAIFLLWQIVLRPQDWPQDLAEWAQPDSWLAFLTQVVMQILLVSVCFGIGMGLTRVAGLNLHLPFMGPIMLSLLSIPIARLAWPPQRAAELDAFLEDAASRIELAAMPGQDAEKQAEMRLFAARLTEPLSGLRDATPQAEIEAHLAALQSHLAPDTLLDALHDRLASPTAGRALRRAFILQATAPVTVEACPGRAAPVKALQVAGDDPELLALFARRCTELLDEHADAWGDCPNDGALEALRATHAANAPVAEALSGLIARNRALAPLA
ncbi:hypothetical protein [Gemmobacter serpentinus]|uniref:hypothetical protein n=1 Tax=Gemmobacter serpentinus TaxID=2652247 RepID=UPI00124F6C86|nr:hypothetical protein [Gemmobacter serpentinus]